MPYLIVDYWFFQSVGQSRTFYTILGAQLALFGITWLVFCLARAVLPKRLGSVPIAAGIAALLSVPAAAAVFTLLFAVGGVAPIDTATVLTAMIGWHVVIGIGEALITGLVVGSVVAVRPDLVYGARPLLTTRTLEIRPAVPR